MKYLQRQALGAGSSQPMVLFPMVLLNRPVKFPGRVLLNRPVMLAGMVLLNTPDRLVKLPAECVKFPLVKFPSKSRPEVFWGSVCEKLPPSLSTQLKLNDGIVKLNLGTVML